MLPGLLIFLNIFVLGPDDTISALPSPSKSAIAIPYWLLPDTNTAPTAKDKFPIVDVFK